MRIQIVNKWVPLAFLFICFFVSPLAGASANRSSSVSISSHSETSGSIRLYDLSRIYISPGANRAERFAANVLRKKIATHYGINLQIEELVSSTKPSGILVGRKVAVSEKMITIEELESVKFDGYVMTTNSNRVAIAGYSPQGTVYGTFAFLRHIGLKFYPWHLGEDIEVFTPINDGRIQPFTVYETPFFELRDLFTQFDDGRFGGTLRQYSLGDLRFANESPSFKKNGYLGWDHTAGYLVPLHLYHEDHPEYFALKKNRRISRSTPNLRVQLCMGNPAVHRISAERALGWIEKQSERRYFMISDGDAVDGCQAPESRQLDPIPDYYTDRLLTWVNSVASKVKTKYPEKIVLTLAYMGTVKPPTNVRPETNVRVLYAPWYWNSRTSSAVSFEHPLNMTAMSEFLGWVETCPGQVGIYDYPQDWVYGTAERIKLYARHGIRWAYFNGAKGDLQHWIVSQLLWNPQSEVDELVDEFIDAFYGPASKPMLDYLKFRKETIRQSSLSCPEIFDNLDYLREAKNSIVAMENIADSAPIAVQTRILQGSGEILFTILHATRPEFIKSRVVFNPYQFKQNLKHYVDLQRRVIANFEKLKVRPGRKKYYFSQIQKNFKRLGIERKLSERLVQDDIGPNNLSFLIEDTADRLIQKNITAHKIFRSDETAPLEFLFSGSDEADNWSVYSSPSGLSSRPKTTVLTQDSSSPLRGIQLSAPMSRIPAAQRGNIKIHPGRFHVERAFKIPQDIKGFRFIDIHLFASDAVPITIYLDNRLKLRSDVKLHAGEQIVRVDLRNYVGTRFDFDRWDWKIRSIAFDVWSQDLFYPYPQSKDVKILFVSMTASNNEPPHHLSRYGNQVVFLSSFRANIPIIKDSLLNDFSRDYNYLWQTYRSHPISEKFRTFTAHRTVSPLIALKIENFEDDEKGEVVQVIRGRITAAFKIEWPPASQLVGSDICLKSNLIHAEKIPTDLDSDLLWDDKPICKSFLKAVDGTINLQATSKEKLLFSVEKNLLDGGGFNSIAQTPISSENPPKRILYEKFICN